MAAQMLDVPAPEPAAGQTLSPEARAALEDQLALAGLDVLAPLNQAVDDI